MRRQPWLNAESLAGQHLSRMADESRSSASFQLARSLIEARTRAGLSQTQLARRMKTSQSYVARIEGGQVRPSTAALERLAKATGSRLTITFEPAAAR